MRQEILLQNLYHPSFQKFLQLIQSILLIPLQLLYIIGDTIISTLQIVVQQSILLRLEKFSPILQPRPSLLIIALDIGHILYG